MQDKVTLTGGGLAGVAVAMVAAALVTGLMMHFVAGASLPLVMVITCLSPAAMVLLLYVAHLVRSRPELSGYLVVLKGLGLTSVVMGLLVLLDFVVPPRSVALTVKSVIPHGKMIEVDMGRYSLTLPESASKEVYEGTAAELIVTPLFHCIERAAFGDTRWPLYDRASVGKMWVVAGGLLLLYPVAMVRFRPRPGEPARNAACSIALVAPSYVLSLIAAGLWIKFLIVHGFYMGGAA